MTEMPMDSFQDFFTALWDKPPFAWQSALADRVINACLAANNPDARRPWPDAIALPTASGKTACIDIAVYALVAAARQTPSNRPLRAPRRIFFVVDRRVIVDEAYDRARKLAARLAHASDGVLKAVADTLRQLGGDDDPLACFQLRGGMYRSDAWAHSPAQPAVIASTVDQLGSRLLFRAYGRSFKAWPIQAGLAGNDALIFLDEAHCAQPFLETLQAVQKYRSWAEAPLAAPFQAVVMSATPPPGLADIFRDDSDQPRQPHHPLGDRQLAAKPTQLIVVEKAKGPKAAEEFAAALVKKAEELVADKSLACVVFCNRVAIARAAYRLLAQKHGEHATLLTGRMRAIDKDDTVRERLKPLSADHSVDRALSGPTFVVATQTLEVGANLDFDLLVTECASIDALRQRFGRLNRMGRVIYQRDEQQRPVGARAAILIRADQAQGSDDDPVYGAALGQTWQWLREQAHDGAIDLGIAALQPLLPTDEKTLATLNAPARNAPVLLPSHVDCWVQTAPAPFPTPDPAVYLHGPGATSADVQVCWRADLRLDSVRPADDDSPLEKSLDVLVLCPPAAAECVAVPIGLMRRWLAGEEAESAGDSDVEGVDGETETGRRKSAPSTPRRVIRWRGRDEADALEAQVEAGQIRWHYAETDDDGSEKLIPIDDEAALRPGDVIVIPAAIGGWRELGDLPGDAPVLDWGDRAYAATRAKALLRLHPAVLAQWPDSPATTRIKTLVSEVQKRYRDDFDELATDLRKALQDLGTNDALSGKHRWLRPIAQNLGSEKSLKRCVSLHPFEGLVVRGNKFLPPMSAEDDTEIPDRFSDEDDASSSGTTRVTLSRHLEGVAAYAQRFAASCRLPPELAQAVERAGLFHDLGKADPRFQALLNGGNRWLQGELLAKSANLPQGRRAHHRARMAAGYPQGGRHELLSVRLIENALDLLPQDHNLRDLVLHLIGSHHGYCRPFAPVVFDNEPQNVTLNLEKLGELQNLKLQHSSDTGLERLDSGVPDRFWRLTRRYGWWGLVWLEAILRLADHRRSEAETWEQRENNE